MSTQDPDLGGYSEEELAAELGRLREAPLDEVLAQVMSLLANAAQVKLGRRDGRALIDLTAALVQQVRDYAHPQLVGQLDEILPQLQMAQVEAEKELAQAVASGQAAPEVNDLGSEPAQERPSDRTPPPTQQPGAAHGGDKQGSRLWTPGT